MHWKKLVVISASSGAGFALVCVLILWATGWKAVHANAPKSWNSTPIKASFVSAQLREIDRGNSSVLLYYNLENNSDFDYRLSDGAGVVIMRRMAQDQSLSSEVPVHLSYSTFIPARQRARIALEVPHAFDWPADNDPARQEKLREFVNQRLAGVDEFVLFDESNRFQIDFPKGWQDLPAAPSAKK